jgi:transposase
MVRQSHGREKETSFGIVDAQSVKNTDTASEKGYDAGKKVPGIKRHIVVDSQGLPHAIHVTTADVTDRNGAIEAISKYQNNLKKMKNLMVDGGYTGDAFADAVAELIGATVEVAKRSELHKFVVTPKKWVVERSFAWLEKCRRLWKNCEGEIHTSTQMIVLAFITLIVKRLA